MQVGIPRFQLATDGRHVGRIVVVVDRIGLRLSHDVAVDDVALLGESQLHQFPRTKLEQFVIRRVPEAVPLEAEIFETVAGQVGVWHQLWRPAGEVLHPAHLHARLVDVDPVIIEPVARPHDQGHREEVTVFEALGGVPRRVRSRRSEPLDQFLERRRRDHMVGLDSLTCAIGGREVHAPPRRRGHPGSVVRRRQKLGAGHAAAHPDLASLRLCPLGGCLPHHAWPLPRIAERPDQRLDLLRSILRLPLRQDRVPDGARER